MIPNIVHFVFGLKDHFGKKPFHLIHYIAIKSVIEIQKPEKVYLHYQYEPTGIYWEKAKELVTLNRISAPLKVYDRLLGNYANTTDWVRLQILKDMGGVYLDIDTITIKPFHDLLNNKCVMAQEPPKGLCNAVILAEPNAEFIQKWIAEFTDFDQWHWGKHGVLRPRILADRNPELITVLPQQAFFDPLWNELPNLFQFNKNYPEAYIHHLWESASWENYISDMTPEHIRNVDTTYNVLARRYL